MRAVLTALFFLIGPSASAESVYVNASYGEVGNGWLFGSRKDSSCWLALPWHVIATMDAQDAEPFFFTTKRGQVGEAGAPLRVSRSPEALAATGGNDDLAFAQVTAGVPPGSCLSRLGLPGAGFALALTSSERLHLSAMQEGSTIGFAVEVLRAVADVDQGSIFLVRPRDAEDRAFLQGGLSGGVVSLEWSGSLHPAGMVLSVPAGQTNALVLRFDKVRQAFEAIEVQEEVAAVPAASPRADMQILGVRGRIETGSTPLNRLAIQDGCWRAAPPLGERAIEILLSIKGLEVGGPHDLQLVADPFCGPDASYVVELRDKSGAWTTHSTACLSGPAGESPCRLPPLPDMELRLRSAAGQVGLTAILIR